MSTGQLSRAWARLNPRTTTRCEAALDPGMDEKAEAKGSGASSRGRATLPPARLWLLPSSSPLPPPTSFLHKFTSQGKLLGRSQVHSGLRP